jgi:hypothetical protein
MMQGHQELASFYTLAVHLAMTTEMQIITPFFHV